MKKLPLILSGLLLAGVLSQAAPVAGEKLSIYTGYAPTVTDGSGSVGTNSVSGANSLAVGETNYLGLSRSLAVGYQNMYYGSGINGTGSLVVGNANLGGAYDASLQNSTISGSQILGSAYHANLQNSAVIGSTAFSGAENLTLQNSVVIGSLAQGNTYIGTGHYGGTLADSLVVGLANSTTLTSAFVAGKNNAVTGQHYVLGEGLIAGTPGNTRMVVLGQFNASPVAGQLLVVGNGAGSGAGQRANALEVYTDGKVKIPKRQGDVGMGRFGNPIDQ